MSDQPADLTATTPNQTTGGSEGSTEIAQLESKGKMQPAAEVREIVGVRNQTNKRLALHFEVESERSHIVNFAPLQKRWLSCSPAQLAAYKELDTRGLVLLEHKDQPEQVVSSDDNSSIFVGVLTAYFFAGSLLTGFMADVEWYNPWFFWAGAPILGIVIFLMIVVYRFVSSKLGWTTVRRGAAQSLTLLLVMLVGLGLTTATIYFFGNGPALLQSGPSLTLLTRILQLHFIGVASLLPALLFYLFDRQQLGTLRDRFEYQIFKLDPTIDTLGDVQAKYGNQLDELYGRDPTTSRGRLVYGTRWPILVCTLVITAGWIMTLQPVGSSINIQTPGEMLAYFTPQPAVLTFGFLGAYYFALNTILRRYTRGDLQPKAYSHITVRIFIVAISAWVIELLLGANTYTRALIFIVGIVPDTFITALQEVFRSNRVIAWALPQLQEKHPLTILEGIDLYDRSRLAEEGVTNVEGLAHHDFIDLILATRIPVSRLVDWVDQAILYLHLSEENEAEDDSGKIQTILARLKHIGIRNATELEKIFELERPKAEALLQYLDGKRPAERAEGNPTAGRMEMIAAAMQDDDWLNYIRHWRVSKDIQFRVITVKPNGEIIA